MPTVAKSSSDMLKKGYDQTVDKTFEQIRTRRGGIFGLDGVPDNLAK